MQQKMERLYSLNQVAIELGVTAARVYQLVNAGRIPFERNESGAKRVRESDLRKFKEGRNHLEIIEMVPVREEVAA